jgi:hypothetical protein
MITIIKLINTSIPRTVTFILLANVKYIVWL